MSTTLIAREFDRGTLAYLGLLERVKEQLPPFFDRARIEKVRKEVEELRLEALAAEIRAEYPDIEIDYELLELVGIDEHLPVEEEMNHLASILEEVYGYADTD
ncbi:MAG: hypothetical protein H8D78_06595 [Chloroflexi bacterium]|nr:hypothetical protein [Chloroflexota bacterium]